jgi:hypothetical protein
MFKFVLSVLMILGFAAAPLLADNSTPPTEEISVPRNSLVEISIPTETSDPQLRGIRLVSCTDVKGNSWSGTMFHYNANRYITANHVATGGMCTDALTGTALKTIYLDRGNDFAIFESPHKLDNVFYKLSCSPFKSDVTYHAVGWAGGETLTDTELVATKRYTGPFFIIEGHADFHLRELVGYIIPGQSGGPVMDDNWVVHGINNASWDEKNLSWSRELKDTILCRK